MSHSINTTLEIFTLVQLGTIILAAAFHKKQTRLDRLVLIVLLLHLLCTLGDLLAWEYAGEGTTAARCIALIGNLVTYLCLPGVYLGFCCCVFAAVTGRSRAQTRAGRVLAALVVGASALLLAIVLTNFRTGALFTIDADNHFHWGPASGFLPDGTLLVQLVFFIPLVLCESAGALLAALPRLLLLCVMPASAVVLEALGAGLMLLYPAMAGALLLLYLMSQDMQEKALLRQNAQLAEGRTQLLLGQIHSHFLFNSLTAIGELCEQDPPKAGQLLDDFAQYLRASLNASAGAADIPFSQELSNIRHYLALELADPASRVRVEFALHVTDFFLPPLTVQPLVENAVRHGASRRPDGVVTIRTESEPGHYAVFVTDNGPGLPPNAGDGIGLTNVRERLKNRCGGTLSFYTGSDGTTAVIRIPKEE